MEQTQYEAAQGGGIFGTLVMLAVMAFIFASMWKVFTKAGQPGWAVLVPIYNIIVMLKIAGKPVWWLVLMVIPLVSLVTMILVSIGIAKAFGKGAGFGLGLAFLSPIFYPILAFGDAEYVGADDSSGQMRRAA
jgi:hypothetical protein